MFFAARFMCYVLNSAAHPLLLQVPFPADMQITHAAKQYEAHHGGACCYDNTWRAHYALGLANEFGPPEDRYRLRQAMVCTLQTALCATEKTCCPPLIGVRFDDAGLTYMRRSRRGRMPRL